MSDLSDFFENTIGDHMLRNQAYTPPTTIYVAAFTASTGLEANTGVTGEVTGGSYARQSVALAAFSGGASSNSSDITFPTATADWGTVTHSALVDHATNTNFGVDVNVLMWDALAASKVVNNGDTLKFLAGEIDVAFT